NREIETLKQKMAAITDNKMSYANMRLIDEMCKGDAYQLHVHGYEEDLPAITPENLYAYYQKLIEEDKLDIYVLGDFAKETMKEKISAAIKRNGSRVSEMANSKALPAKDKSDPKIVKEQQEIQQAK